MKRAILIIAAFTLLVRLQHQKRLLITGQELKHFLLISQESLKEPLETQHSFEIAIETISYSEYYPHSNSKKYR